jgi:hypothetical protein
MLQMQRIPRKYKECEQSTSREGLILSQVTFVGLAYYQGKRILCLDSF